MKYILTLCWPGLGHILTRNWGKGFLLAFWTLLNYGTLCLGIVQHKVWGFQEGAPVALSIALCLMIAANWWISVYDLKQTQAGCQTRDEGYWSRALRGFFRKPRCVLGVCIILVFAYLSVFPAFFSFQSPLSMDSPVLSSPTREHPLGTDNFGRDVYARLVYGSRVAVGVAIPATLLNMAFGGFLGLIAGYFGGKTDDLIMRFLEIIGSIPYLIIMLLLLSIFGSTLMNLIIILGIVSLIYPARIMRSEVLSIRNDTFIDAARAMGGGKLHIIVQHVMPNAVTSLFVVLTMQSARNIMWIASLSFLGFGVSPPTPTWGGMLQDGREFLASAPWMSIFPGLFIILSVFGLNILGDGLRDVMDPKEF